MKTVQVAVIGVGRIGKIHLHHLCTQIPSVEVTYLIDPNLEEAKKLAKQYQVPHVSADPNTAFQDLDIQAVIVCSATHTHASLIEKATQFQKHCFCEKPMDLNPNRILELCQKISESKIQFQLGFNRRFDPGFRKIATQIQSGAIGTPHLVKITSRDPSPPPREYLEKSGGLFLDMTIHDFDMARYLIQDEIVEISARGEALVDPDIQKMGEIDTAVITFRYASGALGVIDNSRRASYGYDQRVEVFGSEGCLLSGNETATQVQNWNRSGIHSDVPLHFFTERYEESYKEELKEFISCIQDPSQVPSVSYIDGLKSTLIALAAKESLLQKKSISISATDLLPNLNQSREYNPNETKPKPLPHQPLQKRLSNRLHTHHS